MGEISEVQRDVVIGAACVCISRVDKLQITVYGAAMFIKEMNNVGKIGKVR